MARWRPGFDYRARAASLGHRVSDVNGKRNLTSWRQLNFDQLACDLDILTDEDYAALVEAITP